MKIIQTSILFIIYKKITFLNDDIYDFILFLHLVEDK